MKRKIVNNRKIQELLKPHSIEIIPIASQKFDIKTIERLNFPQKRDYVWSFDSTLVEWNKVKDHYKFLIDNFSEDLMIKQFRKSSLAGYDNLILSFGWDESVAKMPSHLFLEDPLEYFATRFIVVLFIVMTLNLYGKFLKIIISIVISRFSPIQEFNLSANVSDRGSGSQR